MQEARGLLRRPIEGSNINPRSRTVLLGQEAAGRPSRPEDLPAQGKEGPGMAACHCGKGAGDTQAETGQSVHVPLSLVISRLDMILFGDH